MHVKQWETTKNKNGTGLTHHNFLHINDVLFPLAGVQSVLHVLPACWDLVQHNPIFTSTTEGEGGYVFTPFCLCLSVCLSVCLCAEYLKKLWTYPDETLWTGWVCDKDEVIRCWWRSGSGSGSGYDNYLISKWFFTIERWGQKRYSTVQHDISKTYWAWYVLVDQAFRGGGMRSTECPSSNCSWCSFYLSIFRFCFVFLLSILCWFFFSMKGATMEYDSTPYVGVVWEKYNNYSEVDGTPSQIPMLPTESKVER